MQNQLNDDANVIPGQVNAVASMMIWTKGKSMAIMVLITKVMAMVLLLTMLSPAQVVMVLAMRKGHLW